MRSLLSSDTRRHNKRSFRSVRRLRSVCGCEVSVSTENNDEDKDFSIVCSDNYRRSRSSRVTAPRLFSIFSRQGKREKTECIVLSVFVFCNYRAVVVKFHTIVSSYNYLHLT
jgi:hypothetical protein